MTFEPSAPEAERSAPEPPAAATGAASVSTAATGAGGGTASGSAIVACGPGTTIAAQIFSHTIGRGSTRPTIWLSTPSRYSQAWTMPGNLVSTAIMPSHAGTLSALG